jgi:hypothetical protein
MALRVLMLALLIGQTAAADEFEQPPIEYSKSTPDNAVSRLNEKLQGGDLDLQFDDRVGYLRAVLDELDVPVSSQMLVFSKTSLQRHRISAQTPRAIYFNDDVYIGFCHEGDVLEISAADPKLGTVFYTMDQERVPRPQFYRQTDNCLLCHASSHTQNVPGHVVRSVYADSSGMPILSSGSFRIDHTSPLAQRWGGWYVTGTHGDQKHLGNLIAPPRSRPEELDNSAGMNLKELGDRFDASNYLSPHSDIAALMVLEHQTQAHNLIARANFLTRVALAHEEGLNKALDKPDDHRWESTTSRIRDAGEPLVKYLLFAEETRLTGRLEGTSGFAKEFMARGPFDSQGRSLRDLDLETRLFKYPHSYLVYSNSFEQLPSDVKDYVWQRLAAVLSGEESGKDFEHLTAADRRGILEILTETKADLPECIRTAAAQSRAATALE